MQNDLSIRLLLITWTNVVGSSTVAFSIRCFSLSRHSHRSTIIVPYIYSMTLPNLSVPLSNYGLLSGQLFLYAGGRAAFESFIPSNASDDPALFSSKKCILLGGLSDGLLPVPYTQLLADSCHEASWSLVQPVLSSSYTGFGHGSLQRDCDELQELLRYLMTYRSAQEFCLVGHSTGCQNAVYFLQHAAPDLCDKLRVVALQAPVSDREHAAMDDGHSTKLSLARNLVDEGKGHEMMPRSAFWAPITAQRFVDLNEKGGADDFFSSDFTDEELTNRLRHIGRDRLGLKVLVAFSGADEYVPEHVDKMLLTERLVKATNADCDQGRVAVEGLYLESGNHNLSEGLDDGKIFVDKIAEMLKVSKCL